MKVSLLLIGLIFISGWNFQTHQDIVESVYYSLNNISYLNLTTLKYGAIVPDKVFRDHRLHSYPKSYINGLKWLNETKNALKNHDYNNASYAFGIATHYIADSFSAPHNIKGESSRLHAMYENQASVVYDYVNCKKYEYELNK